MVTTPRRPYRERRAFSSSANTANSSYQPGRALCVRIAFGRAPGRSTSQTPVCHSTMSSIVLCGLAVWPTRCRQLGSAPRYPELGEPALAGKAAELSMLCHRTSEDVITLLIVSYCCRLEPVEGTKGFDPRSRAGGDQVPRRVLVGNDRFDPRPRGGGDMDWQATLGDYDVPIHAPVRGATSRSAPLAVAISFDPRPRAGGDPAGAPTRQQRSGCFDPRPRTGGDLHEPHVGIRAGVFRSTPPHGGRLPSACAAATERTVSIHAPARGATPPSKLAHGMPSTFRSTPPHGGRRAGDRARETFSAFRSTPPHGGRPTPAGWRRSAW